MRRVRVLELGKKGTQFDVKIPAGTEVEDLEIALAQMFIDVAKYRGIGSATFIAEVQGWIKQLEERP